MVREIIRDTEFLKLRSEPAAREDIHIAADLLDTLKANSERCVGMAANMIGERKTILAFLSGNEYIVMINPVITDRSKQHYDAEEACLSLEGTRTAKRYNAVSVDYYDKRFKKKSKTFKGFAAQIIQHEMDHFEGILI